MVHILPSLYSPYPLPCKTSPLPRYLDLSHRTNDAPQDMRGGAGVPLGVCMAGTANPLAATGTKNRKSKNEGTAPRGKDVTLPQGNAGVKKLVGCRGSRGMREMGQLGRGGGKEGTGVNVIYM